MGLRKLLTGQTDILTLEERIDHPFQAIKSDESDGVGSRLDPASTPQAFFRIANDPQGKPRYAFQNLRQASHVARRILQDLRDHAANRQHICRGRKLSW